MVEIKSTKGGCIVSASGSGKEIALDVITGVHALHKRLNELNPAVAEKFKQHFQHLSEVAFLDEEELQRVNRQLLDDMVSSDWSED